MKRRVALLLTTTALIAPPAFADDILPTGGQAAAGSASISTSGGTMTVNQSSSKAVVNWNSFSVGQQNAVNFVQPDSSSAILNRVTGSTTSQIAGSITGNGQVYLINPNGIAITPTGTVKVGSGFVASTLDIDDQDFMSGNLKFQGSGASAGVTNEGVVTVGRGGYAALMGGTVKNSGLIAVPLGRVGLGSGEQAALDLAGDGFMQVALPTRDGAEDDGSLIENSGTIIAEGGAVVVTAATAREAARKAINMSGVVEAKSVSGSDGAITFGGGEGGTVKVAGKVKAKSATGKGGTVKVTAKKIVLETAAIDVSGATGGGEVKIGGDYQGSGDMQRAEEMSVDAATTITADATVDGDGGRIILWSDNLTTFDGNIAARGAGEGKGGFAEVSGKKLLAYTGFTDLSSESGAFGDLLLDPYNLTISNAATSNTNGTATNGDDSVLNKNDLEAALSAANVTVSTGTDGAQAGDITIDVGIGWTADTLLTLDAANDILINQRIKGTGYGSSLALNYGGDYTFSGEGGITLTGGAASFSANGVKYGLVRNSAELENVQNTGNYALGDSLDLSGTTYIEPLFGKTSADHFQGEFAGLGNTISNFTLNNSGQGTSDATGLIGYNKGAIRDLTIQYSNVIASFTRGITYSGTLAGRNYGTIKNVRLNGTSVYAKSATKTYVGSLVGRDHGDISGVTVNGYIQGASGGQLLLGGLVGYKDGGSIKDSRFASGSLTATDAASLINIGGLVGGSKKATFERTSASGNMYAYSSPLVYAGGLLGGSYLDNISASQGYMYTSMRETGGSRIGILSYGGLVGSSVTSTFDTVRAGSLVGADISGTALLGGLIGNSTLDKISRANSTVYFDNINGQGKLLAGGLAGVFRNGTISDAYYNSSGTFNHTSVDGSSDFVIGGITAEASHASIKNVYSNASFQTSVDQTDPIIGGIAGRTSENTAITGAFFNNDPSNLGDAPGVGVPSDGDTVEALGLSTNEFRDTSGFMTRAGEAGWNFETTWAPPSAFSFPGLYATDAVIRVDLADATVPSGTTSGTFDILATYGGPDAYAFGIAGDSMNIADTAAWSAGRFVLNEAGKGGQFEMLEGAPMAVNLERKGQSELQPLPDGRYDLPNLGMSREETEDIRVSISAFGPSQRGFFYRSVYTGGTLTIGGETDTPTTDTPKTENGTEFGGDAFAGLFGGNGRGPRLGNQTEFNIQRFGGGSGQGQGGGNQGGSGPVGEGNSAPAFDPITTANTPGEEQTTENDSDGSDESRFCFNDAGEIIACVN